jgi:ADP-ribosyl-[dinitrogen reductase] hydrolase
MCEKNNPSDRVASSLLGACIGDALASPLHWYYDLQRMRADIKESFPADCRDEKGRLAAFCRAPSNLKHPDSWSYFSKYNPFNDPLGIVHGRVSDWIEPGTYYHAHLEPGEPTTTVQLALLLARSLVAREGYDYSDYLDRCAQTS